MSAHVDRVNVITRQRLLSTDFNNLSRLTARALLNAESAELRGSTYDASGLGGVLGGFMVRSIVGTNEIEISAGIGFVASTPVSATYDPSVLWVELRAAVTVDLTALVDAGNPRLVTIELEPAESALVTTAVDVFDPGTGTFTIDPAAPRVLGSDPTVVSTAGAAGVAPQVAAGTVGRLPIAVVKLVAAQVSFADEFASVLMCRPLLAAASPLERIDGGGVSIGEESGGSIVNLTNLYLSKLTATLDGLEAEAAGLIVFPTRGRCPDTTTLPTLLASAQPVYGYAVPPPWVSDYGALAPREAWQRNPNAVTFASAQNIVGGSGTTFRSLAAETATSPGMTLRNAVVIWDSVGPYGLERGAGNAPLQVTDTRGPHPDTAPGGAGSITLLASTDPTWGNTQVVSDSAYLGAVSSLNTGSFMAQFSAGAGRIRLIDVVQIAGLTKNRPYREDTADVALTSIYPGKYPDMLVGDDNILPISAQRLDLWFRLSTGNAGAFSAALFPALGFGTIEGGVNTHGGWSITTDGSLSGAITMTEADVELELNASGAVSYTLNVTGAASMLMTPSAYTDALLAAR